MLDKQDWRKNQGCSGSDGEALCCDGQHSNEPPSHPKHKQTYLSACRAPARLIMPAHLHLVSDERNKQWLHTVPANHQSPNWDFAAVKLQIGPLSNSDVHTTTLKVLRSATHPKWIPAAYWVLWKSIKTTRSIERRTQRARMAAMLDIHYAQGRGDHCRDGGGINQRENS